LNEQLKEVPGMQPHRSGLIDKRHQGESDGICSSLCLQPQIVHLFRCCCSTADGAQGDILSSRCRHFCIQRLFTRIACVITVINRTTVIND